MHSVNIVESITELKKREWDELAFDNVFASYGWLKTVEEAFAGKICPRYVVIKNSNRLVAVAVSYLFEKRRHVDDLDNILLGRLRRYVSNLGISFMPALICGPLFCYGKHFLVSSEASPEERRIATTELLDTIEGIATGRGLPVGFSGVMDDETELMRLLANRKYRKAIDLPLAFLDIKWGSFSEYVDHLKTISKKARKVVKNEINRNQKEGVVIKPLKGPENHEDRLGELVNDNAYRHNQRPFMFRQGFFAKLKENLGKEARFYVSIKHDAITGVCILLVRNKIGYLPMVGVDHNKTANDFTYFNISFYKPISDAISEGITVLYFGRGMYELKARRGCSSKNVYTYYNPFDNVKDRAVRLWFALLSAWNRCKVPKGMTKEVAK
jgi:predicted N-acyltransferase